MVSGAIQMMANHGPDPLRVFTTNRRLNSGEGRVKVRRSLFGSRTPGESADFVRKEAEALLESDCRKWNFDFKIEIPFAPAENQRWQWSKSEERLSHSDTNNDCNKTITGDDIIQIQCPSVSSANTRLNNDSNKSQNVLAVNEAKVKPESFLAIRNKQYQQTTMHDYMKSRKRNLSSTSKQHEVSTTTSSGDLSSSETPTKIRKTAASSN